MIRQYVLYLLEGLTVLWILLLFLSTIIFSRRGIITRQGLLAIFALFLLFGISVGMIVVLSNHPSTGTVLLTLTCIGGLIVTFGLVWAVIYLSLPYVERWMDRTFDGRHRR
jgi:hypothetical protein